MTSDNNDFIIYLTSLERFGIRFGLESITEVLEQLDNPHLNYATVHVAGTNGKGSVCAMVASMLKAAGYTVGLYTSPLLVSVNERIMINGQPIAQEDFIRLGNAEFTQERDGASQRFLAQKAAGTGWKRWISF